MICKQCSLLKKLYVMCEIVFHDSWQNLAGVLQKITGTCKGRLVVAVECVVGFVQEKGALAKCTEFSELLGQFDFSA